ncbi:uncharacterized protein LOC17889985 [Capsella rubella]|nr:uncharacterized protein LOC17889985 [Capsella rubella]
MADPSGGAEKVTREFRKGNWTVNETLVLIEAKKMEEERRMRRSEKKPENKNKSSELRWKWIEEYSWRRGCQRNQNQCNDKWDNLMRDYKKIREYERSRIESSSFNTGSSPPASYWKMEKSERKERSLPTNMLSQIYEALAELVEKKTLPYSSSSSLGNGGQGFVAPVMAQQMLQIPTTIVLSLQPPPPQPLVLSHPPPFTFHAEPIQPTVDTSGAKRRRTTTPPGETTAQGEISEDADVMVGAAISRSASVIAQVIRESEERQEMRHKEVMRLQERRLKMEESKADINRQGMSGLVDAINQLATSILALASSSSSCHNNHNRQEGPP